MTSSRFVSSLRYFLQKIEASLPTYGMILNRKNQEVLIDIGKKDGLALEDIGDSSKEWLIVKKGSIKTADSGIGITFLEEDILGTFAITDIGEDISAGNIFQKGFYDKINVGDYVVPSVVVTPTEEEVQENQSTSVVVTEPVLLQLLREIRN